MKNPDVKNPDDRLAALTAWLETEIGPGAGTPVVASADASFRRYFRVPTADGSVIAMDAPPEHEETEPFVRIAGLFRDAGLHAPEILAHDAGQGFVLLEDLGDRTYLQALERGDPDADPEQLYPAALDALVRLQGAAAPREERETPLPAYDETLLRRELDLFPDWYVRRHLGHVPTPAWQAAWEDTCHVLIGAMRQQPQVCVHRDFTPRNLMIAEPNPGIIDFQDAVIGPITYDWVSLVRDAFISWPVETEDRWLLAWRERALNAGLPLPSHPLDLRRAIDFTAAQRHLKVIGIFARLYHRDGKSGYLADVPRFFRYLEREIAPWPELAPLRGLLADLPAEPEPHR